MIRLLQEKDRDTVLEYLYKESEFNIFPIGDIEAFGFDETFQKVYGEFDDDNQIKSVLLLYRDNLIYYSHEDSLSPDYVDIMKTLDFHFVGGKESLVELLYPHVSHFEKNSMYFSSVKDYQGKLDSTDVHILTSEEEFEDLYDLLLTIDEFSVAKDDKASFVANKIKGKDMSVTVGRYIDGDLIATASTTAETRKSAMLVGVASKKGYRNQGHASLLVRYLVSYFLLEKKKSLSLFYDNEKAASIYHRLGFKDIGKWMMLREKS